MRAVRVLSLAVMVGFVGLFSTAAAGPATPGLQSSGAVMAGAVPAVVSSPDGLPAVVVPAAAMPVAAPAAPVPAAPRVPVAVPGTPCLDTASACVDLSAKKAWLIDNGSVAYGPVPITSGRKGFRTPAGTFAVSFKSRDHVSTIYDAEMPFSVFFNGGVAFHQGSLKVASHGCIHLSRTAAQKFFGSLGRGEVVQVVR